MLGGQVLLDGRLHQITQVVGIDCIKFDTDGAEAFRARVGRLGRPGREVPLRDLVRRDRDALEVNLSGGRQFAQGLFDLFTRIDAGRVEVAEMV